MTKRKSKSKDGQVVHKVTQAQEQVYAHPSGDAVGVEQQQYRGDEGVHVQSQNPYRELVYVPRPGSHEDALVVAGNTNPDFITGKDVIS